VLEQLEKREAIDVTMAAQLRQQAWLEKIRQQENLADLTACLKNIPADFKRRSKIAATAARALIRQGGGSLAQQLLADSLNAQWDSELVTLYGDCQSGDGIAQIEQAEKWLNQHKEDAGLLLALGNCACIRNCGARRRTIWMPASAYLPATLATPR